MCADKTTPDVDLTDRESFPHWLAVPLRYSDQDPMGHVNNVAYAAYVAEGRTTYLNDVLRTYPHPRRYPPGARGRVLEPGLPAAKH